jgi:hypothetical protein
MVVTSSGFLRFSGRASRLFQSCVIGNLIFSRSNRHLKAGCGEIFSPRAFCVILRIWPSFTLWGAVDEGPRNRTPLSNVIN